MTQPPASIVIPSHARPDYLEVTLASVLPQAERRGVEVTVVIDGPDPAAAAVASRPGVRAMSLPVPGGGNAARNAGIAASRGELMIFLDDDIEAPAGWLEALLEGARANPDHEVLGGPIRARLERGRRGCGREPAPITTLDAGPVDRDVPRVWGANMAVRRRAFERIGPFDPSLVGHGDEEAWLLRYLAGGGRIRYVAAAGLDHRRTPADSSIHALARAAFRHGRETRRLDVRFGLPRPLTSELRVLAGCAWHTVRHRCPYGIVMGARAAGGAVEALHGRGP